MSQFSIQVAGIDASTRNIGRNRPVPSFGGAGVVGYLIGSALTPTPKKNLFTGAVDGNMVGTPDAIGLKQGAFSQISATVATTGVMTVTAVTQDPIAPGMIVEGGTLPNGTAVVQPFGTNGTTGTGGNGTYQLSYLPGAATGGTLTCWTTYFELNSTSSALYAISQAVTLIAFAKSAINQSLIADAASGGNMGLLNPGGAQDVQAFGRDANNFVATSSTATGFPRSNALDYSMMVAQFTATTAQAFSQRSGYPRVASVVQNRTAGAMGSANKLRFGRPYTTNSPSTTAFLLLGYSKLLSGAELDDAFVYGKDMAVRGGVFV